MKKIDNTNWIEFLIELAQFYEPMIGLCTALTILIQLIFGFLESMS